MFTIADYGCADGGTSMPLMYACVKELRKIHGDNLPIHVIYEDQPVNDFKSLFLRLQGLVLLICKLKCSSLRTVPTFVTAHTFYTSLDTRVSYGWWLLLQSISLKLWGESRT